jgi:hypothetical protein
LSDGGTTVTTLIWIPLGVAVVGGVVAGVVVPYLLPLRGYDTLRTDLQTSAFHREEAARRLAATDWRHVGELYQRLLDRSLRWADGFFGPPVSQQAFATCVVLALIYAWLGFWLAYALGAPDALGETSSALSETHPQRALVGLGVPVFCIADWPVGWALGRWERRRKAGWMQRRLEVGQGERRARRLYGFRGAAWAVAWLLVVAGAGRQSRVSRKKYGCSPRASITPSTRSAAMRRKWSVMGLRR